MITDDTLKDSIKEALILGLFKTFCDKNLSKSNQQRIRNIYANSTNPVQTTINIYRNSGYDDITPDQAIRLNELINAFLKKNTYRKIVPISLKKELLVKQSHKCAICSSPININSHADHIVPFKYVGDELTNNYQMLCSDCNLKKNASIDYQIRFLLKTL